jgi:hypothetical protein
MSLLSTLGAGRRAALLLCLAALAAAALRLPGLADRPMHADEAVLADKLGTLLEKGEYRYDPEGYHGPALLYLGLIPPRLAGVKRYADLDERLLRFTPAAAGILLAATPLLLAPAVGWTAAGWAALLLAVSPSFVYYSRYFIPETLLVLFTALFLSAGWRWLCSGRLVWALAAGASAGLMAATKETAVLALAAALAALTPWLGRWKQVRRSQAGFAVLAGLAAAAVLLSSFGQNPTGPWDYLRSYFATYLGRGLEPGPHSHPWRYYFGLLLWFRQGAGPAFTEAAILALAAAGAWTAWRSGRPFLRFLLLYAALISGVVLSDPLQDAVVPAELSLRLGSSGRSRRGAAGGGSERQAHGRGLGAARRRDRASGLAIAPGSIPLRRGSAQSVGLCPYHAGCFPDPGRSGRLGFGARARARHARPDRQQHEPLAAAVVFAPLAQRPVVDRSAGESRGLLRLCSVRRSWSRRWQPGYTNRAHRDSGSSICGSSASRCSCARAWRSGATPSRACGTGIRRGRPRVAQHRTEIPLQVGLRNE